MGESPYFTVTFKATIRLSDLLTHLYVLIPVVDDDLAPYGSVETMLANKIG